MADNLLSRLTGTPSVLPNVTTPQAYTPASSQGLGTLGASQLEWRQVGNKSHIMGKQEVGTVTASEARIALPSGQTIGTFAGTSGRFIVGKWAANNGAGITKNGVVMATTGQTYLTFGTDMDTAGTTSPLTQRNGNDLFSNSVVISFEEELAIPISGWSTHQAYGAGLATATTPGISRATAQLASIRLHTSNGYGSSSTHVRRFTTSVLNQGVGITYADSASLGGTFTITESGVYGFTFTDEFSSGASMGLSKNSSQLTSNIAAITAADRLCMHSTPSANTTGLVYWSGYLQAGDVIRAHTDSQTAGSSVSRCTFSAQRFL